MEQEIDRIAGQPEKLASGKIRRVELKELEEKKIAQ